MTLRNKTLLFIGLTLIALIAVLYSISSTILHRGFNKVEGDLNRGFTSIEIEDAHRNVSRMTDALNMKVENLSIKASDWAQWDDTYQFVQDRNLAYAKSNLEISSVLNLKINYILIFNVAGNMIAGVGLDLEKGEAAPISADLKALLKPGSTLIRHDSESQVTSGILLLKEGPMLFVSRPVLKSDGTGPIKGSLIFGRYLDSAEFGNLSSVTHLAMTHFRMDEKGLPEDFAKAQAAISGEAPVFITNLDEKIISGYTIIRDLSDKPALMVRVDIPRDIHWQGVKTLLEIRKSNKVTLLSLVLCIFAAGLVLGLVILMILEKLVLSRIGRLSRKTVEIGSTGDFGARVVEEGRDEIYSLAASVNKMLSALSQTHLAMESRNAEMRLLMNTIPAGLLSIDENFRVNPEYSQSAQQMLLPGQDLKGKPFAEVLGLTGKREDDGAKLLDYLDMVRQELAPASTLAELNPFDELKQVHPTTGEDLYLRIRYFLIRRGEKQVPHLLVVLENITEEKKLSLEVDKSHKENLQLKAIAEDPDLFREFLLETRQILKNVYAAAASLAAGATDLSPVNEIFRGVHTIKGVAGSFGLFGVAGVAGELEDKLETVRNGETLGASAIEETRASLKNLESAFAEVTESAKKILGEDIESGSGIFLRIPLDELKQYIREIREMAIDDGLKDKLISRIRDEILQRLRKLTTVPARKGLARSVKIVPGLIERLGKSIRFNFEGQDTAIDCETAHELNTPLIHLIRNACDHGIESAEVRMESGKQDEGQVTLSVGRENGSLLLSLSDDGPGLDPEKLKATALKKGFITPEELKFLTRERAFALIFRPGFSTAETVSDVSGRGVGLDAVMQSVRGKLKGEIEVDSKPGAGTRFTIKVPA